MGPRGSLAVLTAASLLVGACSASTEPTATEASEPPAPTSITAAAVATTSTEPSTTTTTEAVQVLLPANDVDDPTEAIVAILEYVSYLHTIPEQGADYLDLVYLETCECFDAVLRSLEEYVDNGWAQDDQGISVHEALLTQSFKNGNVLLQVTESWFPQFVVTSSGNRMRLNRDEYARDVSLVGMEHSEDGRWRVAVIGVLGESLEMKP